MSADDKIFTTLDVEEGRLGKKVTASRDLEAGTAVARFAGRTIDFTESKRLGNKESFAFQTGPDRYVYLDKPFCYFNHSCDPNCGVRADLTLVTLRPVKENEELTYDYSTSMLERSWTMPCRCGSSLCRKTVADFDTLSPERQQYYIDNGVVQAYIINELNLKRKKL